MKPKEPPKIWVLGGGTPAQHPDFRTFFVQLRNSYN
jgi:hypothetical protein